MTAAIHVTRHAAQRYVERIDPRASLDQATDAIRRHTHSCCVAADFGCRTVIAGGMKLVLDGRSVVTVLTRRQMVLNGQAVSA